MILLIVFFMLNFKPTFSLFSFTLIKKLLSSSSLSSIRVVSCTYLRLLIFLLAILSPACDSSSLAFHMIYSAYKGFPGGSVSKESACNAGDSGSIPGREDPLEKSMKTHSSILAERIPWKEEPDGLQSMGSQRVRHDRTD